MIPLQHGLFTCIRVFFDMIPLQHGLFTCIRVFFDMTPLQHGLFTCIRVFFDMIPLQHGLFTCIPSFEMIPLQELLFFYTSGSFLTWYQLILGCNNGGGGGNFAYGSFLRAYGSFLTWYHYNTVRILGCNNGGGGGNFAWNPTIPLLHPAWHHCRSCVRIYVDIGLFYRFRCVGTVLFCHTMTTGAACKHFSI